LLTQYTDYQGCRLAEDRTINSKCDTIDQGFICYPDIVRKWGQYSPYYAVDSDINTGLPETCKVTFVQLLSRHGARYPTKGVSIAYKETLNKILQSTSDYSPKYQFLKNYIYGLGADDMLPFGSQQLINSGSHFFDRYKELSSNEEPFIRSTDSSRVHLSASKWSYGLRLAKSRALSQGKLDSPTPILTMPEGSAFNNSLNHGGCKAFEKGPDHAIGKATALKWAQKFIPPIQARLSADLQTSLAIPDVIHLMDLCPFSTFADSNTKLSPFCDLFTSDEWEHYSHYQDVSKFYGFGNGNRLGPSQGVGWVNELVARLTDSPVKDHTSTNSTLTHDDETFPLGRKIYADFGHDNDMITVMFAMGLFDEMRNITIEPLVDGHVKAWSVASTVPFAGRMYVEKMICTESETLNEEMVRVVVNERIMPLTQCNGDVYGRCRLSNFIESLSFAREGGRWNECNE